MASNSEQTTATAISPHARIASAWAEVLLRICGNRLPEQDLQAALELLVTRLIHILEEQPYHPASAQEIGARLATLGYGDSGSLAQSQRVLWRHFSGLLAERSPEYHNRLGSLLGEFAAGFTDQMRRRFLCDQEEIRERLLVARQQADLALRAERDFVNAVLNTVDALIMVTDARGHILRFNRACEKVSGYTAKEAKGKHAGFLVPAEAVPALRDLGASMAQISATDLPVRFENVWQTRAGHTRQIRWSLTALYTESGKLTHFIGTGLDITEQRAIEEELALARRQLALAEEAERVRLAQDLHDDAVQQLLGLSYQLAEMQGRAADDAQWTAAQRLEEVIPGLEVMRQEIVAVSQGLRRLIGVLRPLGLRDIGLGEALAGFLRGPEWTDSDVPRVQLNIPANFDCSLRESTRVCLFRVAREALWNARKHAGATEITVTADCTAEELWLEVRDDGCGFQVPAHLHRFAAHQRFGLLGVQERVAAEGGELHVHSVIGEGTTIRVSRPRRARGQYDRTNQRGAGGRPSSYP